MGEITIRPTKKLVRAGYTAAFTICLICVALYNNSAELRRWTPWVLALPALLFLPPLRGHLRRNFTKVTVTADKLRFQKGVLTRSVRILHLSRVRDVHIDQTLWQRIFRVGNLTIETAKGEEDMTIPRVDQPERTAELILAATAKRPEKGKQA
jgi:membrane protein YdbS with pleckstrin-like domain